MIIICIVAADLLFAALWWAFDLKDERDELVKVEWLYRMERAINKDADFINRAEKEILFGSDEDREEWQTLIVEREKTAPEFLYFHPHDDWQSKPRKEKRAQPLKGVTTEKKVKETDPSKMDSYELLEENMRRAKNGEHIIDPKTRK